VPAVGAGVAASSSGCSASSAFDLPLIESLNSRIPCPSDFPRAGRRFGPKNSNKTKTTISASAYGLLKNIREQASLRGHQE
jgi:hypothetical protein